MRYKALFIVTIFPLIVVLTSCTKFDNLSIPIQVGVEENNQTTIFQESDNSVKQSEIIQAADKSLSKEPNTDMVAFEGHVYVATINLDEKSWLSAGWLGFF